jgi:hypothetical protein
MSETKEYTPVADAIARAKAKVAAIAVPNDDVLVTPSYAVKEAGQYTMEIVEVETVFVKSGKHEGKPALNLTLQHSDGRKVWKQIPLWAAPVAGNEADRKERDWLRMSRVALVTALGITNYDLVNQPERMIGKLVETRLGVQSSANYGEQNFVVTFLAE